MMLRYINILPGIILSAIIAFISIYMSQYIGINILNLNKSPVSPIILSILIGILISNFIKIPEFLNSGINFSLKIILRLGIICLGIRLGILDILEIGMIGIPLIAACIIISIILVGYLAKIFKISSKMGSLIAVGTSICGASAIVATSPAINADKEEVTYAVANITIFGVIAMLLYPFLGGYIFDNDGMAVGLFLGTSIHETAQVAGAGLIYAEQFNSPKTMEVATVTKLVRNMSMMIVIPVVSYLYIKNKGSSSGDNNPSIFSMMPIFIFGFIIMGIIRTTGDYGVQNNQYAFGIIDNNDWNRVIIFIRSISEYALAIAMAAIGLSTNLLSLRSLGIKPFYVGFSAALCVGVVSIIGINIIKIFL